VSIFKHNRTDDDGHKYLIPKGMLDDFDDLLSRMQNAPSMSEAKWDAEDNFIAHYQQYMVG
jgi:hypothetical protein